MSKIVKTFGELTPQQVEEVDNNKYVTWQRLKSWINMAVGREPKEPMEGIVCDEVGITVKLKTETPVVRVEKTPPDAA